MNDEPDCWICGSPVEWVDCDNCIDGEIIDEDPVNGDEYHVCGDCAGKGGYWQCAALPHTSEQIEAALARKK